MTKVHSEVYMGKTIDIFKEFNENGCRSHWKYTFEIDGKRNSEKNGFGGGYYGTEGRAFGVAKKMITINATKEDEIKKIENEIAELQAKLKALKNS